MVLLIPLELQHESWSLLSKRKKKLVKFSKLRVNQNDSTTPNNTKNDFLNDHKETISVSLSDKKKTQSHFHPNCLPENKTENRY